MLSACRTTIPTLATCSEYASFQTTGELRPCVSVCPVSHPSVSPSPKSSSLLPISVSKSVLPVLRLQER